MYLLQERVGEDAVNRALARFVANIASRARLTCARPT